MFKNVLIQNITTQTLEICYMSLFYFAIGMFAIKKPYSSDRVTARKAKAYIYGIKEKTKLEAVTAKNIYLEECMNPHTLTQSSTQSSITITITRCFLAYALCLVHVYGTCFSYQIM